MAHVTGFPGLRFGIVDVDEMKRIVRPFHAFNFSASSVLSNLSLHSQFSSFQPEGYVLTTSKSIRRVCCRRVALDSWSLAKRPDVRTYPDLMMEGTRSVRPTSVDSLPLCHHETETAALKEVLKIGGLL